MQYFTIDEFTRSDIAAIHGIDNSPSLYAIGNLTALVINVLDPVRAAMGKPIRVTSGYRCPELNARIPGTSSDSQHTKGEAADIVIAKGGKWDNYLLGCAIVRLGNFDQVIFENVGKDDLLPDWIHVSWKRTALFTGIFCFIRMLCNFLGLLRSVPLRGSFLGMFWEDGLWIYST